MPLADKWQELVAKYLGEIILGFVASGLTAVWLLADWALPPEVFEVIGSYATGRIMLGLCLAILGLVAWVIYLHPRLVFDEKSGALVHKRTGLRYCTRCRVGKRLRAPMRDFSKGKGWMCTVCNYVYNNPNYKEPPEPKPRGGKNSWMRI